MMGRLSSSALICAIRVCRYGVSDDSGGKPGFGPIGTPSSIGLIIVYEV
jgi:hypothetical protein